MNGVDLIVVQQQHLQLRHLLPECALGHLLERIATEVEFAQATAARQTVEARQQVAGQDDDAPGICTLRWHTASTATQSH